jgi:hypothetical protein
MRTVILVGTKEHGFIPGKLTADVFIPIFATTCAHHGFQVMPFPDPDDFLARKELPRQPVIVLVYSEVQVLRSGLDQRFRRVLKRAQQLDARVVHPPDLGFAVANKLTTRDLLLPAGVRMPELVSAEIGPEPVFSNEIVGSNRPVWLQRSGRLDHSRYNTRYIDAVHEHAGRTYHVCLRAMGVGPTCVAIYVRARALSEGNPSVHTKNTPLDPDLLNHLYTEIVVPRESEIHAICERIGSRFGPGFYSHDIVPERSTGLLYVCETGFKFDDRTWRDRMAPLRGALACDDGNPSVSLVRSSEAFIKSLDESWA